MSFNIREDPLQFFRSNKVEPKALLQLSLTQEMWDKIQGTIPTNPHLTFLPTFQRHLQNTGRPLNIYLCLWSSHQLSLELLPWFKLFLKFGLPLFKSQTFLWYHLLGCNIKITNKIKASLKQIICFSLTLTQSGLL